MFPEAAVLGHIACVHDIGGPVTTVSTVDDLGHELLVVADELLEEPEVNQVLVIGVELAASPRTAAVHRELGTEPPAADCAVALLLHRASRPVAPLHRSRDSVRWLASRVSRWQWEAEVTEVGELVTKLGIEVSESGPARVVGRQHAGRREPAVLRAAAR